MADKKRINSLRKSDMGEASYHATLSHSGASYFEIRVKGQLDSRWSEWLEGLEVKLLEDGEMILIGPIVDQAALMSVLNKLSRLNLTIRSVNEVKRHHEETE